MKGSTAISLIDHTSLNATDTDEVAIALLKDAASNWPEIPFAVCVFPQFVNAVRATRDAHPCATAVRIATTLNFPSGRDSMTKIVTEAKKAILDGVDELDLVIDYHYLMVDVEAGKKAASDLITFVKGLCPKQVILKVIIESGVLTAAPLIRAACEACFTGGADFIKTSTGKMPVSATPEAVTTILEVISTHAKEGGPLMGLKIAGGVRCQADVDKYEQLVSDAMGAEWIGPRTLRFGSSSLLKGLREPTEAPAVGGY